MTEYRAKANGNILELSPEAAALLVPDIYEPVDPPPPEPQKKKAA